MGHSFGSFVAQQHMAAHGTAAGYVLMGTVDAVDELLRIEERLAAFEPEHLREQVARSWAEETTVETAEEAAQLTRDIPVLVLSGEHDRTTPAAAAHRLAEILRDADEVVAPGAAHMLLQEPPEATLVALRAFLARIGA